MVVFAKIVNGFSFLTIFVKRSILDVWQKYEFASEASSDLPKKVHLSCVTGFWIHLCINYFRKTVPYLFTKFAKFVTIHRYCAWSNHVMSPYVQHTCLITKIIIVFPNHVFLWNMTRPYQANNILKTKKSIDSFKMALHVFLVYHPVHRHFSFFLRQKSVSIFDKILIWNIVDVPEALNNSSRHGSFICTKQIKLCTIKTATSPIIKLFLCIVWIENLGFTFIVSIVEKNLIWRSPYNHKSDVLIQTLELSCFQVVFGPDHFDFVLV